MVGRRDARRRCIARETARPNNVGRRETGEIKMPRYDVAPIEGRKNKSRKSGNKMYEEPRRSIREWRIQNVERNE